MKMESCPQCGVPRECKVWRHCPCGHDFEPGYVHIAEKPAQLPVEDNELHWWSYFARYLAARAALIVCIVVTFYLGRFEWLAWVLFVALEYWLYLATIRHRSRRPTVHTLRSRT